MSAFFNKILINNNFFKYFNFRKFIQKRCNHKFKYNSNKLEKRALLYAIMQNYSYALLIRVIKKSLLSQFQISFWVIWPSDCKNWYSSWEGAWFSLFRFKRLKYIAVEAPWFACLGDSFLTKWILLYKLRHIFSLC